MNTSTRPTPPKPIPTAPGTNPKPKRIAAIDWMRGFVMILMVIDHVSMAYHGQHISPDSVSVYSPGVPLEDFAFFTRWISHICAPTFVFLAGTALAISVERKVAKGIDARVIDKDILYRGAFIAVLDPTLISLFSQKWTFQVLYAIGLSFICMILFRRLATRWLLLLALAWVFGGELITLQFWDGEKDGSILAALLLSTYSSAELSIKYPLLPWLAMMMLGWVFGRYVLDYGQGKAKMGPFMVLLISGMLCLSIYAAGRYLAYADIKFTLFGSLYEGYGNMLMPFYHTTNEWVQWLHVSKYPPSLTYTTLELGLMFLILSAFLVIERKRGVRDNGVLLVFGQTAMFFYLVHRLFLEGTASYLGMRGFFENIWGVYIISAIILVALYPLCLWYRGYKKLHPNALWAKYI
jgi:uncharacterized membrane protein